jgi:hypothetical protein
MSEVGSRRVMSRHCGTNAGCAKSGVISRSIFPLYSSAALREVFCAGCAKSEDGKDSCSMGGDYDYDHDYDCGEKICI